MTVQILQSSHFIGNNFTIAMIYIRYWKIVCWIFFKHVVLLQAYHIFHHASKSILNSLKVAKTPYIDALISSNKLYRHRYFFPGHSGGKFGDEILSKIGLKEALQYDLPEMDELGDLHSLEVKSTRFLFFVDIYNFLGFIGTHTRINEFVF